MSKYEQVKIATSVVEKMCLPWKVQASTETARTKVWGTPAGRDWEQVEIAWIERTIA